MSRPSYRAAIAWIALNDDPGVEADDLSGYVSVALVADLFDKTGDEVAQAVRACRDREAARRRAAMALPIPGIRTRWFARGAQDGVMWTVAAVVKREPGRLSVTLTRGSGADWHRRICPDLDDFHARFRPLAKGRG